MQKTCNYLKINELIFGQFKNNCYLYISKITTNKKRKQDEKDS
jgi:hypothetical protein